MIILGHTFDTEQIVGPVFLLMVLGLWLMRLQGEREWGRWFRRWEGDRKARRDAELAAERGEPPAEPSRGPWD